jgi:hypothetical protein
MKLVMQLGSRTIGYILLNENQFPDREYIQEKIMELKEEFAEQIEASFKEPVFFIDTVPSKMNTAKKI